MRILTGLALLLASAAVLLAQPARPAVAPRSTVDLLSEIKRSGKLRVGVALIVPWAMHNKDGELAGFEIDVAKKLARDLGVAVEFDPTQFPSLIPDLLAGRFDIIVAGLSVEASRALLVNFSQPYHATDVTLAANIKLATGLDDLPAFDKPGVTIGALEGSTAEEIASVTFPNAHIKTYTESSQLFNDLVEDKLQAVVADDPRPAIVAKFFPEKVRIPFTKALATFPAAFAVRRGDMDFVNFLNSWVQARTVNKWLENRANYWFKTTDWANSL